MKWIATCGLAVSISLFTISTAFAEEANKDEEEQRIILPEPAPVDLTVESDNGFFRFMGVGMFAASAGDIGTTEWGLRQDGIYEGNPISTNRGVRIATHVVAPAVVWWTTEKMHKQGRKKLALVLRIGLMVAYSYAAMHNIHTVNNP
jgi:hypothetical protein